MWGTRGDATALPDTTKHDRAGPGRDPFGLRFL